MNPYTAVKNKVGQTPLSLASAGGHLDTVKYLIETHHCDPRSKLIVFIEFYFTVSKARQLLLSLL